MYQTAIELNNRGTALLEMDDLISALDMFRHSLRCSVGYPSNPLNNGMPNCKMFVPQPSSSFGSAREKASRPGITSKLECASPQGRPTSDPDSAIFVHRHGIKIISRSGSIQLNHKVVSSIIIFNLAVVYHLIALTYACSSAAWLKTAQSFYLKSSSLLDDAGICCGGVSTGNEVIDLLSMATCNNLAHIKFELLQYNESRSYFQHLIKFASTIGPRSYANINISTAIEQLKSSLLLNAAVLCTPISASAA